MKFNMNILLTSVGRRSYMISYFKDALKDIGLVHAANSIETYAMSVADKSVITPLIYDKSYIDFLLSYCKEHDIRTILSLFDIDLPILAKNKNKFASYGIDVVISSYEITQICNDKWLTYNFLNENEIDTPQSYVSIDECKAALERGIIKFPLIIKPRWGMGSIGIFEADNINELEVLYQKTINQIFNSYLKHESFLDSGRIIIIQEKMQGSEFGLDVFNDLKGNFITCIPKRKLAMRAGETDSAEIIEDEKLYNLGVKLSHRLRHIANLDVDCFKFGDKYSVLEMNCRFGGQYPFSHLAGADFPKAIIRMLENRSIEKEFLTVNIGTKGAKDIIPVMIN